MGMGVSMDGLRKSLIMEYNNLCKVLQSGVKLDNNELVGVHISEVDECMEGIKLMIGLLCCVYDDDEESFNDLSDMADNELIKFVEENND